MDRVEIMGILPHRDDMLLVDSVELTAEGEAIGTYRVRGDEFFLRGHFPGNPVVPGVILCEIIAQAACLLMKDALPGKTSYYGGIDKVRFRQTVKPGDEIVTRSRMIRQKLNVYVVSGEARVGDRLCVSGEFMFAIT